MPHIIHIGNSFGVKIPKALIEQLRFKKNTELVFKVIENGLLISIEKQARKGWEQQFLPSNKKVIKSLILSEFLNEFDNDEWKW